MHYKRDHLVGLYQTYYENGQLKVDGTYAPFQTKKEGMWKEYFENGNLKTQAQYHRNLFCGIYLEYHKNGNLALKGEYDYFKNNKKGDWIEYYEDGSIKNKVFYNSNGIKESNSASYYQNGNLKEQGEYEYLTGQKDGKWIQFYENGDTLSVSYFRQGKQVGAHYEFHPNGVTKIMCEYNFSGQLHGLYMETDPEGEMLQKGVYAEDEKEGKWLVRNNESGKIEKIKY